MHLGNGAITPECAAITLGAAAIGLGAATVAIRRQPPAREKLALAAGLGALLFAAQAVNVPLPTGMSAHLVGGALAAWLLGPGLGAWTMAIVLAIQALALGDGGVMALGANIVNMALVPAGCVAVCQRLQLTKSRSAYAAGALAAAASVPLAALLIVGQTALFRSGAELVGWQAFAARMVVTHCWIGLVEGGLTLAALAALARLDAAVLAARREVAPDANARAIPWACLALALVLAACASFWTSSLPDGFEAAALGSGFSAWLPEGAGALAPLSSLLGEPASLLIATCLAAILTGAAGLVLVPRRSARATI
jgi:cobalt/nickel transport system permease protein